ncbi:MAG: AAA family ATPase [Actinomycetota bacterium]|nr:AAA family ATPase [Actinomycetota bacterium]
MCSVKSESVVSRGCCHYRLAFVVAHNVGRGTAAVNRGIPHVCNLPCTGLLGRHEESAQIEHLLDAIPGGPVGLGLEGAPGIGKTSLLRDAVASARQRGHRTAVTTPTEPDTDLAFAGLGDLFDDPPDEALAGLPEPQRRALLTALYAEDAALAPTDPLALPRAVLGLLRALSAEAPLLVVIDDEQWLDRPSARVLAFALCRLKTEPVGVLVVCRPATDGPLWPELARGFTTGLRERILAPLGLDAIQDLIASTIGRPVPGPTLRRVFDASGGNPLYALAIARELQATGSTGAADGSLPVPRTLVDAIAKRLDELDPRARDPLLVVAAMSDPTIALIQAVLPQFVLADLDGAERAGVIDIVGDRLSFTHPLLASTHYSRTPAARRREIHRLLAEVVLDEVQHAQHLALGAEAPARQLALTLERAGEHASERGAPEVAARLLEQACRLTPADAEEARWSRTVAAAEQHWTGGDLARARVLLERLLTHLPSGPIRARALKQLAQIRTDNFEAATALFEQALAETGGHLRIATEIELLLAEVWGNRGDQTVSMTHVRAAVRLAEQAEDPGLLAEALSGAGIAAFFSGDGVQRDLMARAIAAERHAGQLSPYRRPSTSLGNQLLWSDDLDAARPLLEGSLATAVEQGDEYDRSALLFHLAHLEWEAGNTAAAERHTREQMDAGLQLADEQAESYQLWLQGFIAVRHGNLKAAREHAEEAINVATRIGDHFIAAFSSAIVAAVELWTGEALAAHARLPALREKMVGGASGFVGSLTLPFWSVDIEALVALGRFDDAQRILDHLFDRARASANPNAVAIAHRCNGLLVAARGDTSAGVVAMEAALAEHERRPLPLEVARTLLEHGTLQRRAKRKSAAKRSLDDALARLEGLNAAMWQARARDELGRIGLRRATATEGLTPAQQRVAELVTAGLSNREIASTLFMSLRTVESHLTKVYRELDVKSRAQLAAKFAARPAGSTSESGAKTGA